jgi:orotate phosphoribosyltransferase
MERIGFIRDIITKHAILDGKRQRLISPRGANNAWLIDLRRLLTQGDFLDAVAEEFWHRFGSNLPFQIGGMEVAAIPIVSAILMKSVQRGCPIDGFIIRKERKSYGAGNRIEGIVSEKPIILIDDIINSGESAERAITVLENEGHKVAELFTIIDYNSDCGRAWRSGRAIEVHTLFKLDDFNLRQHKPRRQSVLRRFEIVWTHKSPDPNFYHLVPKSFPVVDDKRIYFGSDGGLFRALDSASGELIWDFKVETRSHKNIWSAPSLHGGRVYFGGYDGNVYCLDAATGQEIWRNVGAEWVGSSPAIAEDLNRLFIGLEFDVEGRRGAVVALDLDTGDQVWSHTTKRYTHASPAYSPISGKVASGSNDNELLLFDARTGNKIWRFETRGDGQKGSIRHAPAFYEAGAQVITGCADGYIYIVDIKSGEELWNYKTGNSIYTIPLIVGDRAYIGSTDKSFYVLDLKKGQVDTKYDGAAKIFCPPALIEGSIYFGTTNGSIYQIDPARVRLERVGILPDALTNKIAYSPTTGYIYALTYTNQLFALKLNC